jgi:hypothetical protein
VASEARCSSAKQITQITEQILNNLQNIVLSNLCIQSFFHIFFSRYISHFTSSSTYCFHILFSHILSHLSFISSSTYCFHIFFHISHSFTFLIHMSVFFLTRIRRSIPLSPPCCLERNEERTNKTVLPHAQLQHQNPTK